MLEIEYEHYSKKHNNAIEQMGDKIDATATFASRTNTGFGDLCINYSKLPGRPIESRGTAASVSTCAGSEKSARRIATTVRPVWIRRNTLWRNVQHGRRSAES